MELVIKKLDVVAGVIRRDGKYFVAQRPESSHLGSKWEFPGGKIEDGETHHAAIAREMMEEFCVEVEASHMIGDVLHQYPDKLIHLFFYEVQIVQGELVAVEHQDMCWADKGTLLNIDLAGGDLVFVRDYLL